MKNYIVLDLVFLLIALPQPNLNSTPTPPLPKPNLNLSLLVGGELLCLVSLSSLSSLPSPAGEPFTPKQAKLCQC